MLSLVNRKMIVVNLSDKVKPDIPGGRNGNVHTGDYPGYEWMAHITKDAHELVPQGIPGGRRPLLLELATPDVDISHEMKIYIGNKGVGYAHSSDDGWDNKTQHERRSITIAKIPEKGGHYKLSVGL